MNYGVALKINPPLKGKSMRKELKIGIFAFAVPLTAYFFMKAFTFIFVVKEAAPGRGVLMLVILCLAWIIPFELVRAKKQVHRAGQ